MSQNIEPQAGIRRGNQAIDLQAVEVPTGDMFNTDDFNRYLGAMSTLGRSKFYQDKVDDYYLKNRQAMDIEMMNLGTGPKAPINPETGKPFETIGEYQMRTYKPKPMELRRNNDIDLQSQRLAPYTGKLPNVGSPAKAKDIIKYAQDKIIKNKVLESPKDIRRASDSPFPGDVVDAKLEPGEYVLNRNAVKAIGKKELDRINKKLVPRFSDKVRSKMKRFGENVAFGANRDEYKKYLQTGGDVVDRGEEVLQFLGKAGKNIYNKSGDILKQAYKNYGGDAFKASKTRNIMANATDSEGNAISIDQAKLMRDKYGLGKGSYGAALGQAGTRLLGRAGQGYDLAKQGIEAGADYLGDKYQDFKDFTQTDKGVETINKGTSFLGNALQELAAIQGFGEGGDWRNKKTQLASVNTEGDIPAPEEEFDNMSDEQVAFREEEPYIARPEDADMEEFREENPYVARPESMEEDDPYESIIDPLGLGDETFVPEKEEYEIRTPMLGGYQSGGYVPLGGFVKQALRNVYGN